MSNTKPIGVAYSDQDIIGADFLLSDNQLGYTTAAQGSVTQATSKSTAVTLNKSAGRISMNGASLAANTAVTFTLNNNLISSNDIVVTNISGAVTGSPTAGAYTTYVSSMTTGSAALTLRNLTGGALAEDVIINFALIHCQ
jgi:hypothetical protein